MKGVIIQRGKQSWAVVLDVGQDATGKRSRKWHVVHGTKKDAERERARLLHEIHTGTYADAQHLTVREYLAKWLEEAAKASVSGKTYERYEEIVRLHLSPALGHLRLAALRPLHIQGCYREALASGRRSNGGALSAQTVIHHHRVLRAALHQAVKWQLLTRNPADAVELPKAPHREIRVLDEAETSRLLKATEGNRYHLPILLAVTTGLRRGELLALRWQDINWEKGNLAVQQSLEQTNGGLKFKAPKTQKGRRVVTLPVFVLDKLRTHKVKQSKERLLIGPAYEDGGLLFATPTGQPWKPDSFTTAFLSIARRMGFPHLRLHDLRHTHATQLLRQGIHPKVVSERLGHSTIGMTLDIYSHVLPDMQEEAAIKINTLYA